MDEEGFSLNLETPIKTPSIKPIVITLILLVLLYFITVNPLLNQVRSIKKTFPEASPAFKEQVPSWYRFLKIWYWGIIIGYFVVAFVSLGLVIRHTIRKATDGSRRRNL